MGGCGWFRLVADGFRWFPMFSGGFVWFVVLVVTIQKIIAAICSGIVNSVLIRENPGQKNIPAYFSQFKNKLFCKILRERAALESFIKVKL